MPGPLPGQSWLPGCWGVGAEVWGGKNVAGGAFLCIVLPPLLPDHQGAGSEGHFLGMLDDFFLMWALTLAAGATGQGIPF